MAASAAAAALSVFVVGYAFSPACADLGHKGVGVGSGLGLAICYRVVKENGGRNEVTSEPGKGTTFTVFLPVSA